MDADGGGTSVVGIEARPVSLHSGRQRGKICKFSFWNFVEAFGSFRHPMQTEYVDCENMGLAITDGMGFMKVLFFSFSQYKDHSNFV